MLIKEECDRIANGFEKEGNTEEVSDDFLQIDFGCKLEHVNGIFDEVENVDERWKDDVLDLIIKEDGTEDQLKWEEDLDFL